MKQFTLFFFFFSALVSCNKKDAVTDPASIAQTFTNVSYGNDAAQKMDVYLPAGRTTDTTKLIILVHGGAWSTGDKSDFASYISTLQQRLPGYAIANINYRLATSIANHFPTQEDDMKSATNFLIQKSGDYHISQKFVLLGASSGAHMALLQAYKYSSPRIQAVVDFFGPTDMEGLYNFYPAGSINQFAFQLLMNGTPANNSISYSQSSPINYVSVLSSPTIIFHGTNDDIVPIAQSVALKNKLTGFGVANQMTSYSGVGHEVWPMAIMNDAFDKIGVFLKANVH
jgi:acetyl esterase/lipase